MKKVNKFGNSVSAMAYVGYGDLARQIQRLFALRGKGTHEVYFDDGLFQRGFPHAYPLSDYLRDEFRDHVFYVCLGYRHLAKKQRIIADLIEQDRHIPSHIHKTSFIESSVTVGQGTFIYPMCNVGDSVSIGRGAVLNNSATVSHDSMIHDCCYLAPGVIVCGFVEIGENTFVGSGAVISNGVKIGSNVIVGAGTVVTQNIPAYSSVIGNPMKTLRNKLRLI